MNKYWNVKMIYPTGGHLIRDEAGNLVRYENNQQAKFACEVLNAGKPNLQTTYIPVQEE